jgi:hypothetical protein
MNSRYSRLVLAFLFLILVVPPVAADKHAVAVNDKIQELRDGKGNKFTQQLSSLISELDGDEKKQAQEALYMRMCRMKSKTLRNKIVVNDDMEVQRAAIRAIESEEKPELIPDLIELITHSDPITRTFTNRALKSLTKENINLPIFADSGTRSRVQSQWRQWWDDHHENMETLVEKGVKMPSNDDAQSLNSKLFGTQVKESPQEKNNIEKLERRIGRMKLTGGTKKTKEDFYVLGLAEIKPNPGVADVTFMVRQGQREAATFLISRMSSAARNQHYYQWHIFERHKTKQAAEDALSRVRQSYDQYSQYRNQIRKIYNAQNTRRC